MKRSFGNCSIAICVSHRRLRAADIPVIDKTNYAVARQTAETTDKILDTNKEILTTVEETLKAVTGDRGSDGRFAEGSRNRQRVQRLVRAFLRQPAQGRRRRISAA